MFCNEIKYITYFLKINAIQENVQDGLCREDICYLVNVEPVCALHRIHNS